MNIFDTRSNKFYSQNDDEISDLFYKVNNRYKCVINPSTERKQSLNTVLSFSDNTHCIIAKKEDVYLTNHGESHGDFVLYNNDEAHYKLKNDFVLIVRLKHKSTLIKKQAATGYILLSKKCRATEHVDSIEEAYVVVGESDNF